MKTPDYKIRWNIKNAEAVNRMKREWNLKNKERMAKTRKAWSSINKERIASVNRAWLEKNRDAINARRRLKRKTNISFRLKDALCNRMRSAVLRQKTLRCDNTRNLLGATIPEVRKHLESQFCPGMTWKNHGEWEIDHKEPCARFDLTKPEQQRRCFHYTNLQPLWKDINFSKGDTPYWEWYRNNLFQIVKP